MTETDPATAPDHQAESSSAARHPHLHPADATDDLTAATTDGASSPPRSPRQTASAPRTSGGEPTGFPREGPPHGDGWIPEPDLVDDAAGLADGSLETADHTPGDGSVGSGPPFGDVDAMRTAEHGRADDAAEADISDTTPTPTETHPG